MNQRLTRTFRQLLSTDPLIIDTETTGIDMDDEILQIAITDKTGKPIFSSLVKPAWRHGWLKAQIIHGITPAKVQDAPTFNALVPRLMELMNGRCLIGWNVQFDSNMMLRSARPFGADENLRDFPAMLRGLDMRDVMSIYAKCWGFRWEKLGLVCARHGIEPLTRAHEAVGDCQLVAELLRVCSMDEFPVRAMRELKRLPGRGR